MHRKHWAQKTLDYGKFFYGLGLRTPTISTFYCFTFSLPFTGSVASESVSLEVPVDVVPDSAKAYITVLGKHPEILGSKRKNGARGCQGVWLEAHEPTWRKGQ